MKTRYLLALVAALLLLMANVSSTLAQGKGKGGKGGGGGGEEEQLPDYTIQLLGTLGGSWSQAKGMNDAGDVVGQSQRADGSTGPFLFTLEDGIQDLAELISDTSIGLLRPKQMLLGPGGLLYVSSSRSNNILVYDSASGILLSEFVSSESGGLSSPHGMEFHPGGDLLVVSRGTNQVLRFDGSGVFVGVFVDAGSGGLDGPVNMTYGPDFNNDNNPDLYLTSGGTNEVLVYDGINGAFVDVFVATGSGGIDGPFGIEFGPNGDLYVSGNRSRTVVRYDGLTGDFVEVFASVGLNDDGTQGTTGLTFGPNGDLYVATGRASSVLQFDGSTGSLVGYLVSPGSNGLNYSVEPTFDTNGNVFVTSRDTSQVLIYQGPDEVAPGGFVGELEPGNVLVPTEAWDINNNGQIVGRGEGSGGGDRPFRYTPPIAPSTHGTVTFFKSADMVFGQATGINEDGDVCGHYLSGDPLPYPDPFGNLNDGRHWRAFLWTPEDGFTDLGDLGYEIRANAINDRDANGDTQVVGTAFAAHLIEVHTYIAYRAWRYDSATDSVTFFDPVGYDGSNQIGWVTFGNDLNNMGDITGKMTVRTRGKYGFDKYVFRYTASAGMENLGTIDKSHDIDGYGINDLGEIVGSGATDFPNRIAFAYTPTLGMFALEPQIIGLPTNLSGLIDPFRINFNGQICGPRRSGVSEAYLITPAQ